MASLPVVGPQRPNFHIDPTSVGLLLVAAPGVGYVIAYTHELGWAMQFGIPVDLIAPQLGDVLAATAFLFALALVLAFVVVTYMAVRPSVRISQLEKLVVIFFIPAALLLWLGSYGDPDQPVTADVAGVLLILTLIAAVIFRWGIFQEQLRKDNERFRVDSPQLRALWDRVGPFWLFVAVAVVISSWSGYGLGGEQARNQTIFLVSDSSIPEVELAIYGDTVVLAPFDPSKHMVRPAFDIVKIGPSPLHLRFANVGPLKTDRSLTSGA